MTNKEAIETLSHCMVEHRCLDGMRGHCDGCNQRIALDMAIESLKQTQWIPCEERLPEKGEEVLVYLFGDSPYIAWHDGLYWCTEDFFIGDKDEEPLAWMPLPKPYEGR